MVSKELLSKYYYSLFFSRHNCIVTIYGIVVFNFGSFSSKVLKFGVLQAKMSAGDCDFRGLGSIPRPILSSRTEENAI